MKLVLVHNYYLQPGGEDQVFADEERMLKAEGHDVVRFVANNTELARQTKFTQAFGSIWNRQMAVSLENVVRKHQAEVVHFHNTFPLISPSVYYAARRAGAAIVQTLHNFRLICPQATLMREGKVCEACCGKTVAWPAIVHGCYHDSRPTTAVVAAMLATHRLAGTWQHAIDRYIALTQFARDKFIAGGLPADKIAVKPNFVSPEPPAGRGQGGYALFVGRLSGEKGIATLLAAWRNLGGSIPLKIAGDGPLASLVREAAAADPSIEWLGQQTSAAVRQLMSDARALVFPSVWYEGLPKTIVESFAVGTPVVGSRLGSMAEVIDDGRTGLLFEPGSSGDLATKVSQLFAEPTLLTVMRESARAEYLARYTAEQNYQQLIDIYHAALEEQPANAQRTAASAGTPS